jgi:amidase/aspartyl-tRNA(Asn)/glutamyl-tRNA(Gln) amidotransferase subunit A
MDTGFQHVTHGYGHDHSEGWVLNTGQEPLQGAAPFGDRVRGIVRRVGPEAAATIAAMDPSANPRILAPEGANDLCTQGARIAAGVQSACDALQRSMAAADGPRCRHAYVRRFDAAAQATAAAVDAGRRAGVPVPPLAGLAVSVKDLFDVAGMPSTAASKSLADAAPAAADCSAVARLRAAGAALTGHTNLTEFAFSGVGINPHHGTPANAATPALDATPRIPGGSTSGGAVTVAAGAAWAALGSDTRGSIRVPAALHGLVGFKNTQALTPTDGCLPLSFTLDTACAITRSVRDAVLLHELLAARRVTLRGRPLHALRLALPQGASMLDGLDATVARAFERSLSVLRAAGAEIVDVALPADDAPATSSGQISAAEAWAWHRSRLAARAADYDPRVLLRIRGGSGITAADYIDRLQARRRWIAQVETSAAGIDAFVCPTVPMVAPPLQPLLDDDEAFFATNALLLRNPSVVNYLDGCALSLPCQAADELPVGLMVWAPALHDDTVLDVSLAIERALADARR